MKISPRSLGMLFRVDMLAMPRVMGALVALLGAAVLLGWGVEVDALERVSPGRIIMTPNMALGLAACGAALACLPRGREGRWNRGLALGLAGLAITIGGLTLVEYLFGWDLGIDELVFAMPWDDSTIAQPGRMAPVSALCLVLVGIAIIVAGRHGREHLRRPFLRAVGTAAIVIGSFATLGYALNLLLGHQRWNYTGMAAYAAMAVAALGAALLAIGRGERPWALDWKTTLGFVAGIAMMLGAVNISYHFTSELQQSAALVAHRQEVLREIQEASTGLANLQSGERGFLLTGDDRLLAGRPTLVAGLWLDLSEVRSLSVDNPTQQQNVARLAAPVRGLIDWQEQTIAQRRAHGLEAAARMVATGTGMRLWNEADVIIRTMEQIEYALLASDQRRADAAAKLAFLLLPLGVFFSLILLLLALFFLDAGLGERARAQEALRDSEHRYRELVEMAPIPIFLNRADRISFINAAGLRLLRASSETDVVGRSPLEFFAPDYHALIRERVERLRREPQMLEPVEEKIVTVDGRLVPVDVTAASYRSDGEVVIQVVCRDITERLRAETQIRALNEDLERRVAHRTAELEASNKELDAFCYAVSHDLRSPLRAIAGFTRILAEGFAPSFDSTAHGYFDRVTAATERMGHLIDDLLNLSRVTRENFVRAPVDLSALARIVADELAQNEPLREVEVVIAPDLTTQGDARLLRILLENLLGNAWKFTVRAPEPRIEFGAVEPGTFFVRDNGAGFDMRYAEKLFGAFQRLHGVGEFPGTGIGLATVQRIVNRHGGRVWAEAAVNRGATFFFSL